MSTSVERDALGAAANLAQPASAQAAAIAPAAFEAEVDAVALPGDHPAWLRDRLALSLRARELLATLQPIALRVRTFWDHQVRSIAIGSRRLSVDPSGSYRLD